MGPLRLLQTGNLYLDASMPFLGGAEEARQADLRATFERLITLAIKAEVDLVLIAGNLFATPEPEPETIDLVLDGFRRLAERGIASVILPGPSDGILRVDSVLRTRQFPGVTLIGDEGWGGLVSLTVKGMPVHIYSAVYQYQSASVLREALTRTDEEGYHIGVLHGAIGEGEGRRGSSSFLFSPYDLAEFQLDYVAFGGEDFFQIEVQGRLVGASAGSPEGIGFQHTHERYGLVVSLAEGVIDLEPVCVNLRVLMSCELDISPFASIEEITHEICELGGERRMVRLNLTGIPQIPIWAPSLEARCRDSFFFLEVRDRTDLFAAPWFHELEGEETVLGGVARRARTDDNQTPATDRVAVDAFRELMGRTLLLAKERR